MKTPWIVLVVAVVIAVAGVAAIVVHSGNEADSTESERIVLEFRAMPPAKLRVDGKQVGTTPMTLQYPKSSRTIEVEATMVRHYISRNGSKDVLYKDKRTITLDRDQLIDFKADPTNRVMPPTTSPHPRVRKAPAPGGRTAPAP